jgi:predicted nucleic acid-binding protein
MTLHVADASAFGPLLFSDEKDARIAGFEELIFLGACVVPGHWRLEVANQLLSGLRRNRTTREFAGELLTMLYALPLATDPETENRMEETYALALLHNLTIYDAAYLELAIRIDAELITFDRKLRAAARAEGIAIPPL